MDADSYLERLGLDASDVAAGDVEAVVTLQETHVRTVPFETLAITGDPFDDVAGSGVSLRRDALYEKVVERERGGFCFELNGAFAGLLAALGFDVARFAGRIPGDGGLTLPANHLVPAVTVDRTYVVDVGVGSPKIRRPVPCDGTRVEDGVGIEWRVVASERPDADHRLEFRRPGETAWADRYVFTAKPRPLSYFRATCEYLASAPESTFTGSPVLVIGTERGHVKLSGRHLTRVVDGSATERVLSASEWTATVAETFGIDWPPGERSE